ncbi:DUF1853 family protein [Paucihalobacter ruber]|uniref:DUF1853 family protein n=1 Tax=Paucihalobacter ruber TaxID=2567861 RepID=A0A506PHW0_9FLAO|nr:DUF1853 family protein [Paucihalobacter ruber]
MLFIPKFESGNVIFILLSLNLLISSITKSKTINLQLQNQGYQQTPILWEGALYYGLTSIDLTNTIETKFEDDIPNGLRLGKRVEYFALSNLSQQSQIEVIANNIQIQRNKITLGEIDALLMINNQPVHLEIVYKFYLFDNNFGEGLKAWIGPNRKDSLIEKLNRLKNHQLPLLYQPETVDVLVENNIDVAAIEQKVLFKAQLYLPEDFELTNFDGLNKDCVAGRFIHCDELVKFQDCKMYIPTKHNWLVIPHVNVDWLTFDKANTSILDLINKQFSPLVWVKQPTGVIKKYFVTWWQ